MHLSWRRRCSWRACDGLDDTIPSIKFKDFEGGGGGKPQLAQAGAKDASKLPDALELAKKTLMEGL